MYLKKLEIKNFRNLKDVKVNFEGQVFIFEGKNGQGKTNIVESLFFLSKGKSFRTHKIQHLIENNSNNGFVKLDFKHEDLNFEVETFLEQSSKKFTLNGKKTTPIKIFKKLPLIFFSPESLSSIKEGPEHRRNLLDETIVLENESNLETHFEFRKVLKYRNKVLKDYILGILSQNELNYLLDSIDPAYARLALEITKQRERMIKRLEPYMVSILREITNDANVETSVEYVAFKTEAQKTAENFQKILNNARNQDAKIGYTQIGPQKHDVIFLYNGKDSRFFSSQGQQRALILAFKFAQIMYHREVYGYYPILVLDDVLSELDREKRNYLLNFLKRSEVQTFLTTTEFSEDWSGLAVQSFGVENGVVVKK